MNQQSEINSVTDYLRDRDGEAPNNEQIIFEMATRLVDMRRRVLLAEAVAKKSLAEYARIQSRLSIYENTIP